MEHIALSIFFLLTLLATLLLFWRAMRQSEVAATRARAGWIFGALVVWSIVLEILSANHFFSTLHVLPPHILLGILPALITIVIVSITRAGKQWMTSLPLRSLLAIHIVRIPVELTLYALFRNKLVPELMTFSGYNFDILAGISALFLLFIGFKNGQPKRTLLLLWNTASLLLLLTIVVLAVFAAPLPFQQWGFNQPNIAVLQFPFTGLPLVIVPLVLFAHLATFRILNAQKNLPS